MFDFRTNSLYLNFSNFLFKISKVSKKNLLICTWFLKNQFAKINSDELIFLVYFKLDFHCLCSLQKSFWNWFLLAKNPVRQNWFLQLDVSKIKYRSTVGNISCQKKNLEADNFSSTHCWGSLLMNKKSFHE